MSQEDNISAGKFADRLRRHMKEQSVTQVELARAIGVAQSAVSYWLSGRRLPKAGELLRIARVFKVTMESLIADELEVIPSDDYLDTTHPRNFDIPRLKAFLRTTNMTFEQLLAVAENLDHFVESLHKLGIPLAPAHKKALPKLSAGPEPKKRSR